MVANVPPRVSAPRLESRWTEVGGRRMHARVALDAAPPRAPEVVLVHGLVVSSRYMVPLGEALAPHVRVRAPDLPGFGLSDPPDDVLDVRGLADALLAWIEAERLDRPALVANSLGCQVAADLAMRRPDRVSRLVLQGPTMDTTVGPVENMRRWIVNGPRERGNIVGIHLRDYWDAGPKRAIATIRLALHDQIDERLPHVRVPTLVIRGTRDPIVPRAWAERVTSLLPDGRLIEVEGAHTLNFSQPEALAAAILPFLTEAP